MSAAAGGKEKIEWVKKPVPKFIQEFKERTNQVAKPTLESKLKALDADEDTEKADETPLVCVSGGVTEEEVKEFMKQSYGDEAEVRLESSGKKRNLDKGGDPHVDDSRVQFKKPNTEDKKPKEKKKSKMKKVKNTSLLSFGDEEE